MDKWIQFDTKQNGAEHNVRYQQDVDTVDSHSPHSLTPLVVCYVRILNCICADLRLQLTSEPPLILHRPKRTLICYL